MVLLLEAENTNRTDPVPLHAHGDDVHVWIWCRWLMLIDLAHLEYVVKGSRWCSYHRPKMVHFHSLKQHWDAYFKLPLKPVKPEKWYVKSRFLKDRLNVGLCLISSESRKIWWNRSPIAVPFLFGIGLSAIHFLPNDYKIMNVLSDKKRISSNMCPNAACFPCSTVWMQLPLYMCSTMFLLSPIIYTYS